MLRLISALHALWCASRARARVVVLKIVGLFCHKRVVAYVFTPHAVLWWRWSHFCTARYVTPATGCACTCRCFEGSGALLMLAYDVTTRTVDWWSPTCSRGLVSLHVQSARYHTAHVKSRNCQPDIRVELPCEPNLKRTPIMFGGNMGYETVMFSVV